MAHGSFDPGYYVQSPFTIFLIRSRYAQFEAADVCELFALHERELVRLRESIKVRQLCYLTSGRSCILVQCRWRVSGLPIRRISFSSLRMTFVVLLFHGHIGLSAL
jgi:hypothetical protein